MKPFDRNLMPWNQRSHQPGFRQGEGYAADTPGELYWVPVSSSNVDAISWNAGADYPLWVRFRDGAVYAYDTTEDVYDEMFGASSPGRFVHTVLSRMAYRRVY